MAKRNGHHWHLLSRGPLAPFNTSTTGTNMFFQLKVRLNIHISLTGMSHQMVFIFCAHILRLHFKFTYSVAFSENHGCVTFSEIDDVIEQGFFPSKQGLSRVMSHQIAIVNHGRVIFLDQSKASHFFHKKSSQNVKLFSETSFDL